MKTIPIAELAEISPAIHAEAVRIGCEEVEVTGKIWPGGQLTGAPAAAARFVRYSWYQAAVRGEHAIFEEEDPASYHALRVEYGLEEPDAEAPVRPAALLATAGSAETPHAPSPLAKVPLMVELSASISAELERQAALEGITVAQLLEWRFQPRPQA